MSLVKNFFYNSALTVSTYIVNFIVFTIISRTLGVENIGVISYVDNIINYFVLFSSLGISTVGVREIAATKGDKKACSRVFSQLLSFVFLMVIISTIIYVLCIFFIPQFQQYRDYFYIGLGKLVLTPLMIEWLYAGNQDFKFISLRTIIIKVIYLLLIIFCVKDINDSVIYFALTAVSVIINFVVNAFYARKYVVVKYIQFDWKPFSIPIMKMGCFAIITSMYSTFNYVYLGSVSTVAQVGFYYTAVRLYDVIMQLFRSYVTVAMPKMSELLSNSDKVSFNKLITKSFKGLFAYSIPMTVIFIILAPVIIRVIAGPGYESSVTAMRIIMPILVISGINQINGIQVLMPLHKDNVLLVTASLASFVGVISNTLLDQRYGANGAAVTILLSEITGCVGGLVYTLKNRLISIPYVDIAKYVFSSIPYFIIWKLCSLSMDNVVFSYTIMALLFVSYFIVQQIYICKNEILISGLSKFVGNSHKNYS